MSKIEVAKSILEINENIAKTNRVLFEKHGIKVVNIISSPGAGKTSILEKTLKFISKKFRIGVIEGDIQSTEDAQRIASCGVRVVQIETKGACHLDGNMIKQALGSFDLENLDFLIIENVGNLVCPVEFNLGEDLKIAVLSITEGDDKPSKYPFLFQEAGVLLVNKVDLLPYNDCDLKRIYRDCRSLNQKQRIFNLSCRTEEGFEIWISWLKDWIKN